MSFTSVILVALAGYYTVLVLRKLGVLAPLRERKPLVCNVCMSTWGSLPWSLLRAAPHVGSWDLAAWATWGLEAGAAAGATLALLSAFEWTKLRVGLPDVGDTAPGDYTPPLEH